MTQTKTTGEISLSSWQEFPSQAHALIEEVKEHQRQNRGVYASPPVFRGQQDSTWDLLTTLERFNPRLTLLPHYFRAMLGAQTNVESYTGKRWPLPDYNEAREYATTYDHFGRWEAHPGLEFLTYLRHHGFPSPLLDWSASPYVALFFAYRFPSVADRVAVFAFREYLWGGKARASDEPQITQLGPYIATHRRHFAQQCQYTYCMSFTGGSWHYAPHRNFQTDQDVLVKLTMPARDREQVLEHLHSMNINAYSLFATEDSLMETLARELLLRER